MLKGHLEILVQNFAKPGRVEYICIRKERLLPVTELTEVEAIADRGLSGDRYKSERNRQVTLIQQEHIGVIASTLGKSVSPDSLRRNIVVSGINLLAFKGKRFSIGDAVLEYTGECHPCSRMEENLGFGGYNAMRGHGGITAKIVSSGKIRVGDAIAIL